jgi:alkaline phosphatase
MKKFIVCFVAFCLLILNVAVAQNQQDSKIKYIFLFIGDGMGLNQVFLTEKYNELTHSKPLIFLNDKWSFGLSMTECADSNKITDSGAGGTAIACGQRTSFGAIGEYKGKPLQSIAEYLHSKMNFKIGLITSVPINHATPACFYGHQPTRKNLDFLTNNMIASGFEFFAGGGFLLSNADTAKNIYQSFEVVIDKLKQNKFQLLFNQKQMNDAALKPQFPAVVIDTAIRNSQLKIKNNDADEKNSLPFTLDVPAYHERLADYTELAGKMLKNDKGFFIMTEGGKIDWACHENDALTAIYEVNAMNDAILKAYDFYLAHPDNTLILITADHETGGLALGAGYSNENTSANESYVLYIKKLLQQKHSILIAGKDSVRNTQKAAHIGWTTGNHTSMPVGVWAIGKGSQTFSGIMKNSDLEEKILELVK